MRFERWHWLIVFILISAFIHATVGYSTRGMGLASTRIPAPTEVVVTLAQPDGPRTVAKPVDPAKVAAKTGIKNPVSNPLPSEDATKMTERADQKKIADARQEAQPVTQHIRLAPEKDSLAPIRPAQESTSSAETDRLRNETPAPLGSPTAPRSVVHQLVRTTSPLALPTANAGGGSLAPDRTLTGKNGASGPEAPPEDTLYTGGGAGGKELPKEPAKLGGGGGNSILTVTNPLAKAAVPDEKAGIGSGTGGGAGRGNGGGVGFRLGKGNGTSGAGVNPLASLSNKSGNGSGEGTGSNTGTRAPGGGKGTGAETPGTGGEGEGYGRGKGIGIGGGTQPGEAGLSRGIPFGDITGKLAGSKPTGPSSALPARGGVFGQAPTITGNGGPIHIIYLLDTSGSMRDFGKIFKAKIALKKAIIELRPTDMFNIINFDVKAHPMAATMVPANRDNVKTALDFVEALRLNPYTNVSDAMEVALADPTVTHIFLLSDGEPTTGIRDFRELRRFILEKNTRHVQINTLALGVGERFIGINLLRGIALDNEGQYAYINMLNETVDQSK